MQKAFETGTGRPLTFEEGMEVEDVLDTAVEWQEGRIPTVDAVKIGGGQMRLLAIRKTPKEDPRWHALYAFVTHLDKMQGGVLTRQGRFDGLEAGWAKRHTEQLLSEGKVWRGVK